MRNRTMTNLVYLSILFIALMLTACDNPQFTVPTSLHATFQGMRTFCEALDGDPHFIGDGIEEAFGIDYDDERMGCQNCHDASKPDEPDDDVCNNCHGEDTTHTNEIADTNEIAVATCLGCHSRQAKEAELGVTDVHYSIDEPKENCKDCHSLKEMHGDVAGILHPYQSMWDPGARDTTCLSSGCHDDISETEHDSIHKGKLDCSACHLQTVISCYNCHFDTFLDTGVKKNMGAKKDWVFLVNSENGKVRAGSFQSLVYQNESFIVFAPFHSHSVAQKEDARACSECHDNDAINELNTEGKIVVTEWDDETLTHKEGVIPVVDGKLEFAFLDYDSTLETWSLIESTTAPDYVQYGYCTAITDSQIAKLALSMGSLKQYIVDNELMDAETLEKLKIE